MHSARILLAAAALAAAAAGTVAVAANPVTPKYSQQGAARRYDAKRSLFGDSLGATYAGRRARPGWSNRQVQRMAIKRRNQVRHRRAIR